MFIIDKRMFAIHSLRTNSKNKCWRGELLGAGSEAQQEDESRPREGARRLIYLVFFFAGTALAPTSGKPRLRINAAMPASLPRNNL